VVIDGQVRLVRFVHLQTDNFRLFLRNKHDVEKESGKKSVGVESLQSHMILTMSHWSSGLTCLLPATRVTGSNPLGGLT
jgi:hypothetical protein